MYVKIFQKLSSSITYSSILPHFACFYKIVDWWCLSCFDHFQYVSGVLSVISPHIFVYFEFVINFVVCFEWKFINEMKCNLCWCIHVWFCIQWNQIQFVLISSNEIFFFLHKMWMRSNRTCVDEFKEILYSMILLSSYEIEILFLYYFGEFIWKFSFNDNCVIEIKWNLSWWVQIESLHSVEWNEIALMNDELGLELDEFKEFKWVHHCKKNSMQALQLNYMSTWYDSNHQMKSLINYSIIKFSNCILYFKIVVAIVLNSFVPGMINSCWKKHTMILYCVFELLSIFEQNMGNEKLAIVFYLWADGCIMLNVQTSVMVRYRRKLWMPGDELFILKTLCKSHLWFSWSMLNMD